MAEDVEALVGGGDPLAVAGQHYDMVLNGVEIGGGSIRIHDAETQRFVLESVLQLSPEVVGGFSHLLEALASGTPPHGGIAFGFDRLVATLCEAGSLRDVIAFPKSAMGNEPLTGAPAAVTVAQLAEYRLVRGE